MAKHRITAAESERMGEAGIFHTDSRLELLEGSIYEMSPIGSRHAHPQPADVLLVIEVADTTLDSDRRYKLPLHAKAGITRAPFNLHERHAPRAAGDCRC